MAFNINDLMSERSKGNHQETERRVDENVELIDIYKMIPSADNFYDTEKIMDLVQSIKICGILNPLILTDSEEEEDMYDMISGHRRREACKYLVEHEHLDKFRMVPCIIREKKDEVIDKLSLIMANRFRDKTDWEKMQECIQVEKLLTELIGNKKLDRAARENLKELFDIKNDKELKVRDFVAEIMNMSASQVGRYKTVYNNLNLELMNAFKDNVFAISIANECAGLSHESQDKCVNILKNDGTLTLADVQRMKQIEKESQILPGQTTLNQDCEVQEQDTSVEDALAFYSHMNISSQSALSCLIEAEDKDGIVKYISDRYKGAYGSYSDFSWQGDNTGLTMYLHKEYGHDKVRYTYNALANNLIKAVDVNEKKEEPVAKSFIADTDVKKPEEPKKEKADNSLPATDDNIDMALEFIFSESGELFEEIVNHFKEGYDGYYGFLRQKRSFEEILPFDNDVVNVVIYGGYFVKFKKLNLNMTVPFYYFWKRFQEKYKEHWEKPEEVEEQEPVKEVPEEKQEETEQKESHEIYHVVDVSPRKLGEIAYANKPYIILKDDDFLINDRIRLQEVAKDKQTGRYMAIEVKNVEKNMEGIAEGYCILLFRIVEKKTAFFEK